MSDNNVRVSCVGLCSIKDESNRFLLVLNQNRFLQGKYIYMPPGGALQYYGSEFTQLFSVLLEEPNSSDLRFAIDAKNLEDFQHWFLDRTHRESTPFRELNEELVEELKILDSLELDDVVLEHILTYQGQRVTNRKGVNGLMTYYFIEVFETSFLESTHVQNLHKATKEDRIIWVTQEEIQSGKSRMGDVVDATILLAPSNV